MSAIQDKHDAKGKNKFQFTFGSVLLFTKLICRICPFNLRVTIRTFLSLFSFEDTLNLCFFEVLLLYLHTIINEQ
jgi:hypothetical protein